MQSTHMKWHKSRGLFRVSAGQGCSAAQLQEPTGPLSLLASCLMQCSQLAWSGTSLWRCQNVPTGQGCSAAQLQKPMGPLLVIVHGRDPCPSRELLGGTAVASRALCL